MPLDLQPIEESTGSGRKLDLEPLDLQPLDLQPEAPARPRFSLPAMPDISKYVGLGLPKRGSPIEMLSEFGNTPAIRFSQLAPPVDPQFYPKLAALQAPGRGLLQVAESLTTPMNAALAALMGKLPTPYARAASGGFAFEMGKGTVQGMGAFQEALNRGDRTEAIRLGTELVATGALTGTALQHALMGRAPAPVRTRTMMPEERPIYSDLALERPRLGLPGPAQASGAIPMGGPAPVPAPNYPQIPGATRSELSALTRRPFDEIQPELARSAALQQTQNALGVLSGRRALPAPDYVPGQDFTMRPQANPADVFRARLNNELTEGFSQELAANDFPTAVKNFMPPTPPRAPVARVPKMPLDLQEVSSFKNKMESKFSAPKPKGFMENVGAEADRLYQDYLDRKSGKVTPKPWSKEAGAVINPVEATLLLGKIAKESKTYQDFRKAVSENQDLRDTARYHKMQLQSLYDKQKEEDIAAAQSIKAAPQPIKAAPQSKLQTYMADKERQIVDRFAPLKRDGKKELGEQYGEAYVGARLLSGKIRGVSEKFLDDVDTSLSGLKNAEEKTWMEQIYALKNFADLDRAGKTTSGVSAQSAAESMASIKSQIGAEKFARLEQAADKLANVQNETALNYLVDKRVINAETAERWRKQYPNYLKSEVMDDSLRQVFPGYSGLNAEPLAKLNTQFLKSKKGTPLQINTSVVDVIKRSLVSKVALAEKLEVADRINSEFGVEIGQVRRAGDMRSVPGSKIYTGKVPAGYAESPLPSRDRKLYALPKDVANLVKGLDVESVDMVTKAVSSYNRFFRSGATMYRAPFVLNNLARDVFNSLFLKRGKEAGMDVKGELPVATAVANLGRGFVSALKSQLGIKDEVAQKFFEGGSGYGGLITSLPDQRQLPFRLRSRPDQIGTMAKNVLALPFEAVRQVAEIGENTTRMAEFLRARKSNLPPELQNLAARDITVDFEKMGDGMRVWNKWIPFLNATLQGNVNYYRAAKEQPKLTALRMGTMIVAPTVGLYALWQSKFKEEYDQIDPWIKENYWVLPSGYKTKNSDGKTVPVVYTIRKAEVADTISNLIEKFLNYASEKDPEVRKQMGQKVNRDLMSEVGHGLMNRLAPPVVKTPFEWLSNYNLFTRRHIVPESRQRLEARYQTNPGDSRFSRILGSKSKSDLLSPAKIEYVLRGVFPAAKELIPLYTDPIIKAVEKAGMKISETPPLATEKERTPMEKMSNAFPFFKVPRDNQKTEGIYEFANDRRKAYATRSYVARQAFIDVMRKRTPETEQKLVEALQHVIEGNVDAPTTVRSIAISAGMEFHGLGSPELRALLMLSNRERAEYIMQLPENKRAELEIAISRINANEAALDEEEEEEETEE